jgi:hypothetical protein
MKQCKIAYYLCCSQFTLVHKFIWEPFSTPNLDLCCCFFVFIHFKHNLQVDIYIYKWMDPETKIVAYNSLFVANFLCGSGAPEVDLLQKHVVRRGISTDHLGASAALRTFSSKLGGSFAVDIPISRILVNRFICLHISIWFNMYYICSYMWICYCSHDRNLCGAVTSLRTGLNLWLSGHPIISEKPKYMYIYICIYTCGSHPLHISSFWNIMFHLWIHMIMMIGCWNPWCSLERSEGHDQRQSQCKST